MRIETELAPLKLTEFKARNGYLVQGTGESWERLVQSEMTLRARTTRPIVTRVTIVGMVLSSISAATLVLGEIYRHLDGAITGQIQAGGAFQGYLVAGVLAGLTLAVAGRLLPGGARKRSQLGNHRHQ